MPGDEAPRANTGPFERRDGRELGGRFLSDPAGNPLGFDRAIEILTGWEVGSMLAPVTCEPAGATPPRDPIVSGIVPPPAGTSSEQALVLRCHDGSLLEVRARVGRIGGSELLSVEVRQVLARLPAPTPASTAPVDPLTRAMLNDAFQEQLRSSFTDARRLGHPLALVLVDIDHMHAINEALGTPAGDAVLQRVAGILQVSLRQGDLVARTGADDFAVLMRGVGRGQARHVGGRLRQAVEHLANTAIDAERQVTVSIGVACYPADGTSAEELMRRARLALGEARRLGKNRVWCYQRRPRVGVELPVSIAGFSGGPIGAIRDLSNSGVFVETSQDLPVDMRVGLSFLLPGDDAPLRVIGRVARRITPTLENARPAAGLGIEFESYGERERDHLEAFLHRDHK